MLEGGPITDQKLQEFQQTLADWERAGYKFQDQEFASDIRSLLGFATLNRSRLDFGRYTWQRASDVYGSSEFLWNDICVNDIRQGDLGDCYLLSAIAALAEYPNRVKQLFVSDRANQTGLYSVELCIGGIWQQVWLDDFFPYCPRKQDFAFCKTKQKEIWVMLLEKAYAKVYGGYDNINGGTIDEALHELTGAPTKFHMIKNKRLSEEDWQVITDAERRGFVMGCCTGNFTGTGNDANDGSTGLSGSHAYTLLGAYELVSEGAKKRLLQPGERSSPNNERILKLRNPWGHSEWKGQLSDSSAYWTSNLEAELNYNRDKEDGIFFMGVRDFEQFFVEFQVCHFHDRYLYNAKSYVTAPSDETLLTFTIAKPGVYYFSVNQLNSRQFKPAMMYQYSPLSLMVVRQTPSGSFEFVGAVSDAYREIFIEQDCQLGVYFAYILTPWTRRVNQFSFAVYGPEVVEFGPADPKYLNEEMKQTLKIGKARTDKVPVSNFASQGYPLIEYKYMGQTDPLKYVYFNNKTADVELVATVTFNQFDFAEVLPPYSGKKCEVLVPPGQERILLYRSQPHQSRITFNVTATFKQAVRDPGSLVDKIKAQGFRQVREDWSGRDVGISVFAMNHKSGMHVYYENNSQQLLVEDVTYRLTNCAIEGLDGPSYRAHVEPGSTCLVTISQTDPRAPFTMEPVSCSYQLYN